MKYDYHIKWDQGHIMLPILSSSSPCIHVEGKKACSSLNFVFINVHFCEQVLCLSWAKIQANVCLCSKNYRYGLTMCKKKWFPRWSFDFDQDHVKLSICLLRQRVTQAWKRLRCRWCWCWQKVNSRKPQRGGRSEKNVRIKHHKISRTNGAKIGCAAVVGKKPQDGGENAENVNSWYKRFWRIWKSLKDHIMRYNFQRGNHHYKHFAFIAWQFCIIEC